MAGLRYSRRASTAMTGPRSDPPMPMLTTSVIGCAPVAAIFAAAHRIGQMQRAVELAGYGGHDRTRPRPAWPLSLRLRSAMWSAGRPSVALTRSPAKRCAIQSARPRCSARRISAGSVSSSSRWREKSSAQARTRMRNNAHSDQAGREAPAAESCRRCQPERSIPPRPDRTEGPRNGPSNSCRGAGIDSLGHDLRSIVTP